MNSPTLGLVTAFVAGFGLIATGVAGLRQDAPPQKTSGADRFVVRNVRVFDGEKTIAATDVLVRGGVIASVGGTPPPGVTTIDGHGQTLLPGLIDAHTHTFGNALERALVFGVTTELDMFTEHVFAESMRKQQRQPGGAPRRADLFSAGTLVTAPGGHGTEYGMNIPTLTSAADAPAFVKARIAEGSDYIKIVYDDGKTYGLRMPSIDLETMKATIAAAKREGKLAVVHVGSKSSAEDAIAAGANGLIHIFADAPAEDAFVARVHEAGAFVTPTLSVNESATGVASGAGLSDDPQLKTFVTPAEQAGLGASFPKRATSRLKMEHAFDAVKRLHTAGVPILAGSDAPNPGTAHGLSIHRELELLVKAGLSPEAALAAATAVPAKAFSLGDRGRIAAGMRADLLLVSGDPTRDILATRHIVGVWKGGVRADRPTAPPPATDPVAPTTSGIVSSFDNNQPSSEFGAGWQPSADSLMGGKSDANIRVVQGGANGTAGALEITGTLAGGAPYAWAGAMFFPGSAPMSAVNLSRFKEIVFWARGDGAEYQVMVFATRLGDIPAVHAFKTGDEWREYAIPFAAFSGMDGAGIKGVLFSAGPKPGAFRLVVDEVRFR